MKPKGPGSLRKTMKAAKNFLLALLFLLIPVAGAFHPKLRRREDPDEKEIGNGMEGGDPPACGPADRPRG
jgi:hypothetical protein